MPFFLSSTGSGGADQQNVEWLHVMAQGVSNNVHWLGPPEGWMGLRSMEQKTGDNSASMAGEPTAASQMHLTMDDEALLARSVLPAAAANGIHVNSFRARYESSLMPDGSRNIGSLVVQLVDAELHRQMSANENVFCSALEKLKLGVGTRRRSRSADPR